MLSLLSTWGLSSLAVVVVLSIAIGYAFLVATVFLVAVPIILESLKERGEKSA